MPPLSLPSFELNDAGGTPFTFPSRRHALLAVVGDGADAATDATLRLLDAAATTFGQSMDIFAVHTRGGGPGAVGERPGPHVTVLEDPAGVALRAIAATALPAVVFLSPDGERLDGWTGFSRKAWQALFARLISVTLQPAPVVEWLRFPPSAPARELARDAARPRR
ncbi:MAG: hypothetical protein IT302_07000 [Dehalococcoidia bacterium]|nr:hypothetical protein [Dehalococcoidia bacterium]